MTLISLTILWLLIKQQTIILYMIWQGRTYLKETGRWWDGDEMLRCINSKAAISNGGSGASNKLIKEQQVHNYTRKACSATYTWMLNTTKTHQKTNGSAKNSISSNKNFRRTNFQSMECYTNKSMRLSIITSSSLTPNILHHLSTT